MFEKSLRNPYSARNTAKPVSFYCSAPGPRSVFLVGEFNAWNRISHPMQRRDEGCWFIQLQLHHGHHQYQFIVDGQPILDPQSAGIACNERNERVSLVAAS